MRQEGAEALAGGAGELDVDRVVGQALMAVALGDVARQHGADGAVDVADRRSQADRRRRSRARPSPRRSGCGRARWSMRVVLALGVADARASPAFGLEEQLARNRAPSPSNGRSPRCLSSESDLRRSSRRSVRKPIAAISSRTSSATKKKKLMTCSGRPLKRLRSTGSCVATPTGQVLRWHLRIMMQPAAISGAVEKPNSSAPSSAAITTSRPVRKPPSTWTRDAAAQPVEHQGLLGLGKADLPGLPACLIEVSGEAPVPPSKPEMVMWSARALATPAATVPTPTSETSLTETSAAGLTFFRSKISWARSSIE